MGTQPQHPRPTAGWHTTAVQQGFGPTRTGQPRTEGQHETHTRTIRWSPTDRHQRPKTRMAPQSKGTRQSKHPRSTVGRRQHGRHPTDTGPTWAQPAPGDTIASHRTRRPSSKQTRPHSEIKTAEPDEGGHHSRHTNTPSGTS